MTQGDNFAGLPEIIRQLAQSPEIADIIKNSGIGQSEANASPKEEKPSKNESITLPPDIMEKLPLVMAALQGAGAVQSQQKAEESSVKMPDMNEIASKLPQVMSALSAMGISGAEGRKPRGEDKNRKALLSAIRPYMSDRKKGAIDTMLGMGSLAEIIKMLMGGDK